MKRKDAREAVFSVLFSGEFLAEKTPSELWREAVDDGRYTSDAYAEALTQHLTEHSDEILEAMQTYAVGWKINRISKVSRTILKIAICEMFYMPDIPLLVSVNEGVELSKKYDDEKTYGFVNGVLNAASKDERATEQ